ncbi:XRE family transcriptional regulator [Pseudoxanthomonas sp. KAs_5_3]|nr:XRE family transcriptional regulator [Pseudoxanthomonas sp. KAs_5_3]
MDARRIRTLREQRAWSQEHLATVAGLSTRTLQRIESGAGASHDTCLALASALDVAVSDLTADGGVMSVTSSEAMTGPPAARLPAWLVMAMLLVLLVVWFGYTIGKDMALRDNRADAACARDARACGAVSTR